MIQNRRFLLLAVSLVIVASPCFAETGGKKVDIVALSYIVTFGQNTINAAGTAEVLGATKAVRSCSIRANTGNSGNLYIGDSTVTQSNGRILDASDPLDMDIDSTSDVYINADTSDDGYSYICLR